jgi:hypothetical protein
VDDVDDDDEDIDGIDVVVDEDVVVDDKGGHINVERIIGDGR